MNFLGGGVLDWVYSLALLVLGFALVLLEIFVIPGINIFGIVGFLTAVAGIGYAYTNMGGLAAGLVAGLVESLVLPQLFGAVGLIVLGGGVVMLLASGPVRRLAGDVR